MSELAWPFADGGEVNTYVNYDWEMRVYVHGTGRTGRAAWPLVSADKAVFADLSAAVSMRAQVAALAELVPSGSTLVAHSSGAVPAVLAIAQRVVDVDALVLVEPALYDIARGVPAIERHIKAMTRARTLANTGDLFGYWSIVRPMLFGGPADPTHWEAEQTRASRFAAITPPWGYSITLDTIMGQPTLVITGGWNTEYEAIAAALASRGATHEQLIGNNHRPQDHPDFETIIEQFKGGLDAPLTPR